MNKKEKGQATFIVAIVLAMAGVGGESSAQELSLLSSLISPIASNGDSPRPDDVHIARLTYAGSGCPAGTVSELVTPDGRAFTLLFDNYVAEAGPGIPLSSGRKNCQIAVDLRFPSGFSYSIFEVDYRGYAKLDRGATGVQKSSYYFQGSAQTASLQSTFNGALDQDYQFRDTLGLGAVVWSPCGAVRALNMNTQVRVSTTGASQRALLTTDSIDGNIAHTYKILWRSCR